MQPIAAGRTSTGDLAERRAANAELIAIAQPHLEWLSKAHLDVPHVASLVDRDGLVLASAARQGDVVRGSRVPAMGAPVHAPDGATLAAIKLSVATDEDASARLLVVAHVAFAIGQELKARESLHATGRELEAQLRQAQKMEAVGQLAGGVAHDFNNLLTIIDVHAELALEDLDETNGLRADLLEVKKASARAAGLTRQLLAFSRKQLLQPERLPLNAVVDGVAPMLRRLIGEDIAVIARLDPDCGSVFADPGQLEQVVINLAVNARDAMLGGGMLTIDTSNAAVDERSADEHAAMRGRYVCLTVADTGCGISPEVEERIFEPFFTTKPAGQGTGLGLSTVYGIVRQSGGHILVDSEPGQGTSFRVYLPLAEETTPARLAGSERTSCPCGTETVLVVEDEDAVRVLARRILERQGYTVLDACNGRDAVAIAARGGRIDLVLTDMVMPGMNGRALAEALAVSRPSLPVLYMSGYTDDEIVRRGLLAAGGGLLQKPFTVDSLARAVRTALAEQRAA